MSLCPQSQSVIVPVVLIQTSSGSPLPLVASGSVTCYVQKADGSTPVAITVTGGNWSEITTGNFANNGEYLLTLPNTATSVVGFLRYMVTVTGCFPWRGQIDITAARTDEIYSRIGAPAGASVSADIAAVETHASNADTQSLNTYNRLGAPAGASVSADIAQVETHAASADTNSTTAATNTSTIITNVAAVKADTQRIKVVGGGEGSRKISGTQENMYDTDGTTILQTFNLKDGSGNPTTGNPSQRIPTLSIP